MMFVSEIDETRMTTEMDYDVLVAGAGP